MKVLRKTVNAPACTPPGGAAALRALGRRRHGTGQIGAGSSPARRPEKESTTTTAALSQHLLYRHVALGLRCVLPRLRAGYPYCCCYSSKYKTYSCRTKYSYTSTSTRTKLWTSWLGFWLYLYCTTRSSRLLPRWRATPPVDPPSDGPDQPTTRAAHGWLAIIPVASGNESSYDGRGPRRTAKMTVLPFRARAPVGSGPFGPSALRSGPGTGRANTVK